MDTKIKKWLTAGLNIYGHYRNNTAPRITQYDGLIQQAMYFPSTISPKKENGEYNNAFFDGSPTYNPMGYIWESNNSNKTINNRLQGYVQFNILDGLTFRSQLGVLFDNRLNTSVENEDSYYNYKNKMTQGQSRSYWNTSWLNTNTLSYVKEFNKITVSMQQLYSNNPTIIITTTQVLPIIWIISTVLVLTTWHGLTLILPLSVQIASSIH